MPARRVEAARVRRAPPPLERRALPHRRGERAVVEIVELAADRHAMGETRHLDRVGAEQLGDVMRGGLAVDRGIDGEHDLLDAALGDPRHQARQIEVVRPDAVERRQRAAEHVIAPARRVGALQRPEIADQFDDDQDRAVAPLVGADRAGVARVDVAAHRADDDLLVGDAHRLGERPEQRFALADQMQRGAPRRARAQARQAREQLDQPLDFGPGDVRDMAPQNGSFMPGGKGSPAVRLCIFSAAARSALALASA